MSRVCGVSLTDPGSAGEWCVQNGRPIQCTDDVGDQGASYESGWEVAVEDMATDADRFQPAPAPAPAPASAPASATMAAAAGDGKAAKMPDTIVIPGDGGQSSIVATGLAQNLQPGVNFQIGHTNYMTVNQNRDGTSHVTSRYIKNKRRITESTAPPEERHLRIVSTGIARDWQALGRRLQLPEAMLDQLRMDFGVQGQVEINRQMLRMWQQTSYPTTLRTLAQALADMGRGDLADALAQP